MSEAHPLSTVTVTMLGGFSISSEDTVLTDELNRSLKLWNVLAYLIVHRDRTVSQAELIDQFWQEERSSNPASALKTLLYRIRTMLQPIFGSEIDPILSRRNAYTWNPAIHCQVDTDAFSALCRQAEDASRSAEEQLELCRRAAALYRGDFLPKLSNELWTVSLSTGYHTRYLQIARRLAELLEARDEFVEMSDVCTRASALDPLDEEMHILCIRSLLRQGKTRSALAHYQAATDQLYRSLGVRPSQELRALYDDIMVVDHSLETDLERIQEDLQETASRPGAFVCEYGFFRECYRLEVRRTIRTGVCVHIALLTILLRDDRTPPLKVLTPAMDHLQDVLVSNLRQGDVVSKYSGSQFVVMLHAANYENSAMVMDRVSAAFCRSSQLSQLKLTYKIRALE